MGGGGACGAGGGRADGAASAGGAAPAVGIPELRAPRGAGTGGPRAPVPGRAEAVRVRRRLVAGRSWHLWWTTIRRHELGPARRVSRRLNPKTRRVVEQATANVNTTFLELICNLLITF